VPGRPYYVIERARALANAGQVDEALSNLRALCDARPEDPGSLVPWADIAYTHSRVGEALEACARLEKLDPDHPSSHAIAGAARCQEGELEAGLSLLRRALHLSPTYAWAHRELGKHLGIAKRHDEAIAAYAANAGLAPDVRATFLLGSALTDAEHYSVALRYLRRVAGSGELDELELARVASVMRIVSGVGDTHAYFQSLTADNPRDSAMLAAHVRFLVEELWYPGAAASVIAKLSELDPDSPFVLAKEGDDLMDASSEAELRGEELLRMAMAKAQSLVYPRRLLTRQLNARGRFDEALALLGSAKQDEETTNDRVDALLGLEREPDARQAIESYVATLSEEDREAARRPLLFRLAQVAQRHAEALEHARFVSKQEGEMPDDGELSPWEKKQFSCLVALGHSDEAFAFGEAQCNDAEDRGDLAYAAWQEGNNALAARFAEAALALDPSEVSALHVMAKQAESAGDEARALAIWERMIAVTGWHIHVENIARLALAQGDLERAKLNVEKAVATGHTCHVALQIRAEVRLLSGDREGARLDAERAFACTPLEWRSRSPDTAALLAALDGRADEARRGYDAYQSQEQLTPSNQARLTRVLQVLGL
jgi:tetratricopeptide (TPR) repeat protein